MVQRQKTESDVTFYVAIVAMIVLVFAVSFLNFGSLLQKILLLVGAFVLFLVAKFGNQKVLQSVELIVTIGAILAFFDLAPLYALVIMLVAAIVLVVYLFSIEHYKKEPIGAIGSVGFILLAIGLSFNTGSNPLITGFSLGFGARY
jgi:membrane-associated HD superfamily phosphohydrolase